MGTTVSGKNQKIVKLAGKRERETRVSTEAQSTSPERCLMYKGEKSNSAVKKPGRCLRIQVRRLNANTETNDIRNPVTGCGGENAASLL